MRYSTADPRHHTRASTLWRLNWLLLLLHAAGATIAWSDLPRRIPTHFGFLGAPDAWAHASLVSWFGLPVISVAVSAFVYLVSAYGPVELWNIPDKERFLRLSPQQRIPVMELLHAFMAIAAICTTVVLLALHVGLYLVANGYDTRLPWYITGVMYGAIVILLAGIVPWLRAVRRALREA